jgi:hypothetical protein
MVDYSVLESYKKKNKEVDVMGVIRTLFNDIEVETFLENRKRKGKR